MNKKKKTLEEPSPQSDFSHDLTRVAVAQICQSVGFTSSNSSALQTLTTVASRYLQTLSAQAASRANRAARTQSNLLDLVAALEDLHSAKGFVGASDVSRPLLRSALLVDIVNFVDRVDETPFAQPIRRSQPVTNPRIGRGEDVEVEVGGAHIPRWLLPFPDRSTYQEADKGEKLGLGGCGEMLFPYRSVEDVSVSGSGRESGGTRGCDRRELQAERFRVKFRFGVKRKNGLEVKAAFCDNVLIDENDQNWKEEEKKKKKVYGRRGLLLKNPEKRIVRSRKCTSLTG